MPRQKSIITVIRDLVRQEVNQAMKSIFGALSGGAAKKPGPKKGSRPGPKAAGAGPGRPPGKRGPGRPKGSKNKPKPQE